MAEHVSFCGDHHEGRLGVHPESGPQLPLVGDIGERSDPELGYAVLKGVGLPPPTYADHADPLDFRCLDDRRGFPPAHRSKGGPEPEQGVPSGQVGAPDSAAADQRSFKVQQHRDNSRRTSCGRGGRRGGG